MLIELRDVRKSYNVGRPSEAEVLHDITLQVRRGDFSIGEGAWAKFDIVANDVQVRVRLHASSK